MVFAVVFAIPSDSPVFSVGSRREGFVAGKDRLIYVFEEYSLDPNRRELRRGAELIAVEPRVFDLLQHLIQNRDRVVSKDDLITAVWSGRIVSDSALTSRMNAARHAIGDSGEQQRLIRTVARKGHRFVGEVREEQYSGRGGHAKAVRQPEGEKRPLPEMQAVTFCKTSDGINIAVASVGEGPVLVRVSSMGSHLEYDWQNPIYGPLLQRLASGRRLVRYDGRGNGLSDRNASDISLATHLNDLDAVVDSLKLERLSLFGISGGAATAIAYAVRHQDRVSKLIAYGGYALGRNKRGSPQSVEEAQAFITMLRGVSSDAPLFWRAFNSFFLPNASPEQFKSLMDYHLVAASPKVQIKMRMAVDDIDIQRLLPKLDVPTIVFHCLRDNLVPFEQGRLLAVSIPNAKFIALESENHLLLSQEPAWSKLIGDIEAFLADEN